MFDVYTLLKNPVWVQIHQHSCRIGLLFMQFLFFACLIFFKTFFHFMSQNDTMNKSVRFHFIPHQHLLQSGVTFWCHKNVKSAVFVHKQNRWRHSLIENSITWVDDFVLSLVVLKVSPLNPSITFKQLNQQTITLLYVCMVDPLPLMCSTVRQWPHFDVIGGTLQKKKTKRKFALIHPNLIL